MYHSGNHTICTGKTPTQEMKLLVPRCELESCDKIQLAVQHLGSVREHSNVRREVLLWGLVQGYNKPIPSNAYERQGCATLHENFSMKIIF